MHATGAKPTLGNFKTATFAEQDIFKWYATIFEAQFSMAYRGIVITKGGQWANQRQSRCIFRHQHLSLLQVTAGVFRIRLAHNNKDACAHIHGASDKPLAAVEHPLIALLDNAHLNIGGVTTGDLWLGHGIG